jgi:prepilin-type N-terminal cleavage/methylation domain-containing protein
VKGRTLTSTAANPDRCSSRPDVLRAARRAGAHEPRCSGGRRTADFPAFALERRSLPGFTLLEISIVLFLMGLMMLIAMPYFGGFHRAELKSATRRLAGRATYLFEEASSHKLVIRLIFDLDRNGYTVMTADPYAPEPRFFPDHSSSGAPVILPVNVRFRDVTVEGVGTFNRGAIACQFYPGGYADATVVHLVDGSGDAMTLGIDPLSGRVMIANGYLTQKQLVMR